MLEYRDQIALKINEPYMPAGDLVNRPRMCQQAAIFATREHFACQLAYLAEKAYNVEVTVNEAYSNQSIGVYGGMYVVGTETTKGFFAQGVADDVQVINKRDYELIRSL